MDNSMSILNPREKEILNARRLSEDSNFRRFKQKI